jgi:hypothetical protein
VRGYDGSARWDAVETRLRHEGYALAFACTYSERQPDDFAYTGRETGWEMRRLLMAYCVRNAIVDYRIVRNTSYLRDLHGPAVYELWTRRPGPP